MSTSALELETAMQEALRRMQEAGCAFADARFYADDSSESLFLRDGNLEGNSAEQECGIGVRVLCDGAWGFAATADLAAIPACFDARAGEQPRGGALAGLSQRSRPAAGRCAAAYRSPVERDPFEVPLAEKLALLRDIDAAAAGAACRPPLCLRCNSSAAMCVTGTARAPRWSAGR